MLYFKTHHQSINPLKSMSNFPIIKISILISLFMCLCLAQTYKYKLDNQSYYIISKNAKPNFINLYIITGDSRMCFTLYRDSAIAFDKYQSGDVVSTKLWKNENNILLEEKLNDDINKNITFTNSILKTFDSTATISIIEISSVGDSSFEINNTNCEKIKSGNYPFIAKSSCKKKFLNLKFFEFTKNTPHIDFKLDSCGQKIPKYILSKIKKL